MFLEIDTELAKLNSFRPLTSGEANGFGMSCGGLHLLMAKVAPVV